MPLYEMKEAFPENIEPFIFPNFHEHFSFLYEHIFLIDYRKMFSYSQERFPSFITSTKRFLIKRKR